MPRLSRTALLGLCVLALLATACAQPGAALETLEPSPGATLRDRERLEYEITEPGRDPVRGELSAERTPDGWLLTQRYASATNEANLDLTRVTVNEALRPLSSERSIQFTGGIEGHALDYDLPGKQAASTRTKAGKIETREIRLRDNAYDNDAAFWLWRSLPLAEGYTSRYASVNSYERSQSIVVLTVVGSGEVTVPAGTFETWRLLVVNGRASRTAWIEVAPPHRLVQWDNGSAVMQLSASH